MARADRSALRGLRLAGVVIAATTIAPLDADAAQAPDAAPARVAEHVTLRWDAPDPDCPRQSELASRLHALLGADPVQLAATGRVQRLLAPTSAADEWRLDLELRWAHRDDLRTLYAGDCRSLADATIVLVAVLAAPLAAARRFIGPDAPPADATSVQPPSVVAPAPTITREAPRVAPPSPLRRVRPTGPFMRIAGALGLGALPGGDFGVTLAAGGLLPRVRLEAAATFLPARAVDLPGASGRGGTISLAAIAARACPRLRGGAVELALCGSLEAGVVPARSVGLAPQQRSQGPWLALGLGGALEWWFSSQVALHVGVEGLVAPVLTSYRLGEDRLYTQRRLGVRAGLGLTIALGRRNGGRTRP